jgi:hypothetical protein
MAFAEITLWCFVLIGVAHLAATPKLRGYWRAWVFAVGTLFLVVALDAVLWATGIQLVMEKRWFSDALQGMAIVSFPFTFVGWAFVTMRLWRHDLLSRCPACLRRLGLSDVRGNPSDLLIAPLERETICLHGHGANIESRWGHAFETDRFTASSL